MPLKILIADDNATVRRLLRRTIEDNAELNICGEAENGRIAVEQVRQSNPDVVILDFQMPVMNGLEAAREIGRIAPKTTLVLFTLYAHAEVLKQAEAVGIRRVFSKPDSFSHLVAWLRTMAVVGPS
ncbi:MAG: response regulator [Acidobacteria bacterium]|nr:response regulator [Acidobacteriota bacterium]